MRIFTCCFILLAMPRWVPAQAVSFTNQTAVLHPVTGFAAYSDCVVDMNGDYLDDVVRVGGKGIFIDYQQPDGSFTQRSFFMPVQVPPSWSICAGDLDNNGFNDLLLASIPRVSFMTANAAGTAYEESVMPVSIVSQRSTLADIDNDGWLDAFVCHDTAQSMPFRNNGVGQMIPDTNLIHTSRRPGSYSAIWTDYDNDGAIDLYITKCEGGAPPGDPDRTNLLYRNNGDGTFTEVGAQAGLDDNAQSWSTVFEDFDNDGDFDAFIVNHDFQNRLFRNNGNGTFTDVIAASGINPNDLGAFENASGDFNNDGFMDIFSELQQRLYLGHGDLTFTGQGAPVTPGAIADLNDDGFLDIMHDNALWLNTTNAHHWVKLNLWGTLGNRNGIGSRVEIYGSWGRQVRELRSGQSYSPMNSLTVHFGLGAADHLDSMVIKWPSGIVTRLVDLVADTSYLLPEAPCLLPPFTVSIDGDTQLCPGDSIRLIAPAGFAQYRWSDGSTGQNLQVGQEGRYALLLTDTAGCMALSSSVLINKVQERKPVITAAGSNRLCAGDTLQLTASMGENYTWSTGATASSKIDVTQPGSYTVAVDGICPGVQLVSAPFTLEVVTVPIPLVSGVAAAPGDSLLLTAVGEHLHWYDQDGTLLDTGTVFQTPPLDSSTTFYVESRKLFPATLEMGGKPDTAGAGGLPAQVGYLLFEAWRPFRLLSVTVYVPVGAPAGTRFIQLFSRDSLLIFKQFVVQPGLNVLELDFDVPVGRFSLRCPQGNLFRNMGALDYPYPLGDVGRITGSSFGDQFYYYFYNWKLETERFECSSERVPVPVIITTTGEIAEGETWRIFPNPASGEVFLETSGSGAGLIRLIGATGQEIWRKPLIKERLSMLDLSGLPAGFYHLQLWNGRRFEGKKLVVW